MPEICSLSYSLIDLYARDSSPPAPQARANNDRTNYLNLRKCYRGKMLVIPMEDAGMARARFMYLIFMFFLFMIFSPNPPNPHRLWALEAQIEREKHAVAILNNATYHGPFEIPKALNLTGANFTVPDHVRHSVDSIVPKPAEEDYAYYNNITGVVRGKWYRIPLPDENPFIPPEIPDTEESFEKQSYIVHTERGNITYRDNIRGHMGKFSLDLSETKTNASIQFVEATLSVNRIGGDSMYDTRLQGVHFPQTGEIVLTTTSVTKFDGLPLIPYLTSNNQTFDLARDLIRSHLESSMEDHAAYRSTETVESPLITFVQCDMIIFLTVLPLQGITQEALSLYETELRFPTGQSIARPPAMELSGVMYSPDCGTALEWRDEKAVKVEKFWHAGRVIGTIAGLVAGIQVWIVLKEMAERGSPSSVSKVSFWTIAMQALMSGYCTGIYLVTAILLENVSVTLLATTFMSFVLMMYELRFLGLIFRVQRPERPVNRPLPVPILPIRQGNGTPQNTPANTALNTPAPNTPATATVVPTPDDISASPTPAPQQQQQPPFETQWEPDTRSEYFIITKYFYVSVLSLFIVTSWLSSHRILINLLLVSLHSFWVPQIYRNVMRGVRKALGWRYVFGMTLSRGLMATWLIWYQRGDWVFLWESEDSDTIWGWILLGWLWIQVIILLAQEIFGPRFFVSSDLLPPTYNYFAPHLEDEEADPESGKRHDCAICMQPIEFPALPVSSSGGSDTVALSANVLGRKVARTPCGHIFHTTCLEQWMKIKLACPICRLSLPPL